MTWPIGRAPVAPRTDWRRAIEELLPDHAPDGARCRACGRLPDGMTLVNHQATVIFNHLVQADVLSVYDQPDVSDVDRS